MEKFNLMSLRSPSTLCRHTLATAAFYHIYTHNIVVNYIFHLHLATCGGVVCDFLNFHISTKHRNVVTRIEMLKVPQKVNN